MAWKYNNTKSSYAPPALYWRYKHVTSSISIGNTLLHTYFCSKSKLYSSTYTETSHGKETHGNLLVLPSVITCSPSKPLSYNAANECRGLSIFRSRLWLRYGSLASSTHNVCDFWFKILMRHRLSVNEIKPSNQCQHDARSTTAISDLWIRICWSFVLEFVASINQIVWQLHRNRCLHGVSSIDPSKLYTGRVSNKQKLADNGWKCSMLLTSVLNRQCLHFWWTRNYFVHVLSPTAGLTSLVIFLTSATARCST